MPRSPGSQLPDRVDAVFFDAGDTLLAPEPSFQQRFHQITTDHGERFDEAAVAAAFDAAIARTAWIDATWHDPAAQQVFWERFYTGVLADLGYAGDPAPLSTVLFRAFSDPAGYKLFPDVAAVLDELAGRGLTLGIISNFEPWLTDVLVLQGVHDRFATVTVSGVLRVAKPDPAIFRAAVEEAGVDAAATVYVGDSPTADIEGARAAGLHPVLLDRFDRNPDLTGCPRITRLTDLLDVLPTP